MTHYCVVSDETMQDWLPRCEWLARPLVGLNNAEFDDLVQTGWIFCWQTLQRGIRPSTEHIRHRMLDWCRYLHKLDRGEPVSLDALLEAEEDFDLYT